MKARFVNEAIKHLPGRTEEEIEQSIKDMSLSEIIEFWRSITKWGSYLDITLYNLIAERGNSGDFNAKTIVQFISSNDEDSWTKGIKELGYHFNDDYTLTKNLDESIKHLKPRSEEEIKRNIKNQPIEDWRTLLYETGMDHFSSNENLFIDFIYDFFGRKEVFRNLIGATINTDYYNYGHYQKLYDNLTTIERIEKMLSMMPPGIELETVIDHLTMKQIKDLIILFKLDMSYINESIKHLPGRTEQELQQIFKKLTPKEKLKTGARQGSVWLVKDAIAAGANMHMALQWASGNGHAEVVRLLLDAGANVHAYNDWALQWASQNGRTEVVKLLLDAGANVHANSDWALRWASLHGYIEVVKLLLGAGANVHAMDDWALQWASNDGHVEVVKLLLNAGADVHANSDWALRRASLHGYIEVVKLLKQHMKKKVNESIKHLPGRTKQELKQSMKGVPPSEKLCFGLGHKIDSIIEEAKREYYPILRKQCPTFVKLYEKLKKTLGEDFDYTYEYFFVDDNPRGEGDFYSVSMIFSAGSAHFLVAQNSRETHPYIKVAKKTNAEHNFSYFTAQTYISNMTELKLYVKAKIKENTEKE